MRLAAPVLAVLMLAACGGSAAVQWKESVTLRGVVDEGVLTLSR